MYKMAAVGDFYEVAHFCMIGAETFFPKTKKDAAQLMERLEKEAYAIIFVSEKYAVDLCKTSKSRIPAIVTIPDVKSAGSGKDTLHGYLKKATGSDMDI